MGDDGLGAGAYSAESKGSTAAIVALCVFMSGSVRREFSEASAVMGCVVDGLDVRGVGVLAERTRRGRAVISSPWGRTPPLNVSSQSTDQFLRVVSGEVRSYHRAARHGRTKQVRELNTACQSKPYRKACMLFVAPRIVSFTIFKASFVFIRPQTKSARRYST